MQSSYRCFSPSITDFYRFVAVRLRYPCRSLRLLPTGKRKSCRAPRRKTGSTGKCSGRLEGEKRIVPAPRIAESNQKRAVSSIRICFATVKLTSPSWLSSLPDTLWYFSSQQFPTWNHARFDSARHIVVFILYY